METLKFGGQHAGSDEVGGEGEGGAVPSPRERILLAREWPLYLLRKGPFSPEREEDQDRTDESQDLV